MIFFTLNSAKQILYCPPSPSVQFSKSSIAMTYSATGLYESVMLLAASSPLPVQITGMVFFLVRAQVAVPLII